MVITRVPATIYLFKVKSKSTKKRCETCSKLAKKISEQSHLRRVYIVNFEHILHIFLVFLLLTLNKKVLAETRIMTITSIYMFWLL